MPERFESECDTWLVVLSWGAVVVCAIGLSPLLLANIAAVIKGGVLGVLMLTLGMVAWVNFGTYYLVDAEELTIRSGPFRWRIPIAEIRRVIPTRAPWSSPALSLNRLRIEYGAGKQILVSPERREQFVSMLRVSDT